MEAEKNFDKGLKKSFFIEKGVIIYGIFVIIMFVFFTFAHPSTLDKPEFLSISEYEMIKAYIAEAEEQMTSLARIVDSRELSEENLKLIDEAIVELGGTVDALKNILEYRE